MKTLTREWLDRAADDLNAARLLLDSPDLTHLTAFHAQQVVEKALKAVIEEHDLGVVRTHSLTRLLHVATSRVTISTDLDDLDRLEAAYIEARYSSESGCYLTANPPPRMRRSFLSSPNPSINR